MTSFSNQLFHRCYETQIHLTGQSADISADEKRQELLKPVKELEGLIDTLKQKIPQSQDGRKKTLEAQLSVKKAELKSAEDKLKKYDKEKEGTSTASKTHHVKSPPQQFSSEVIASFPGGLKKQATGLTMRAVRK